MGWNKVKVDLILTIFTQANEVVHVYLSQFVFVAPIHSISGLLNVTADDGGRASASFRF